MLIITRFSVIYTIVTATKPNRRRNQRTSILMKRSGWAPGTARIENTSRKKTRARTVNQILKDSYKLHARDRDSRKAVKACLG
jgi:hypothetical protein